MRANSHHTGRHPGNAPDPIRAPTQGRNRICWRVEPTQATRAAQHPRCQCDNPLRLLLRGEWPYSVPDGRGIAELELHQVARRGEIQGACEIVRLALPICRIMRGFYSWGPEHCH